MKYAVGSAVLRTKLTHSLSHSTLIFAAHDTTSSALSRILHLLALHPEAQDRLRAEVTAARADGGDLSYEQLEALPFLDATVRETLRLYVHKPGARPPHTDFGLLQICAP